VKRLDENVGKRAPWGQTKPFWDRIKGGENRGQPHSSIYLTYPNK